MMLKIFHISTGFGDHSVVLTEAPMARVDWYIEGVEFSNCNCDYACPCQFESRRPRTEIAGASRPFSSTRPLWRRGAPTASAQPSLQRPGPICEATASVRPSSMSGRTAGNGTL